MSHSEDLIEQEMMEELEQELEQIATLENRIAALESKLATATAALEEIAGQDFRGNRPHECVIAYEALLKIKEKK